MTINHPNVKRTLNGARCVASRTLQARGILVHLEQAAHRRVRHLEGELSVQPDAQARARLWVCLAGYCVLGSASAVLSSTLEETNDEPHAYAAA